MRRPLEWTKDEKGRWSAKDEWASFEIRQHSDVYLLRALRAYVTSGWKPFNSFREAKAYAEILR